MTADRIGDFRRETPMGQQRHPDLRRRHAKDLFFPLRDQRPLHLAGDPAKVETVDIVRGERRRRLHKAFLRYHDAANWPLLREALAAMGRSDLIGNGKQHLIPTFQPGGGRIEPMRREGRPVEAKVAPGKAPRRGALLTQHSGLPPRETGSARRGAVGVKPVAGRKRP